LRKGNRIEVWQNYAEEWNARPPADLRVVIEGRVVGADGKPLGNARVHQFLAEDASGLEGEELLKGFLNWAYGGSLVVDKEGKFQVALRHQTQCVRKAWLYAVAPGYAPQRIGPIAVGYEKPAVPVTIELKPGFTGRIKLVLPDGKALDKGQFDVAAQDELSAAGIPMATLPIAAAPLRIENCPAGPVHLRVRVPGFREYEVRDVQLAADKITEVKVTLFADEAMPPKDAEPVRESRAAPTAEELFARKVSLTAKGMPLKDALKEVARAAMIELVLDVDALKEADLDLDQRITVTIKDKPLADALGDLINWYQHPGAMRELRGGKLVITTLQAHQAYTQRHLPEWLKPVYNRGLLAKLDDDHNVVSITAGEVVTDALLAKFKTLPKLRELHVETTKALTPAGLAHLAELSSLEKLSLYNLSYDGQWLGDAAIGQIVGLRSLRELSLGTCGMTDEGAGRLAGMSQLRRLSLNGEGRLTDAALASIAKLKRLQLLSLSSYVATEQLGHMRFTEEAIRRLSELEELEELHLVGHAVPADVLVFPRLKTLSLGLGAWTMRARSASASSGTWNHWSWFTRTSPMRD
jgi:hypothetical protein